MVLGPPLFHLKHCAARVAPPYYAPCTSYKHNVEWLQHTTDRTNLGPDFTSAGTLTSTTLASYLWAPGPTLYNVEDIRQIGALIRYNLGEGTPHLGAGAAVHMSDPAEPVSTWLKHAAGIHAGAGAFAVTSAEVMQAMRSRSVTAELLGRQTSPWCDSTYRVTHESELDADTQQMLRRSWPWTLRHNPDRYPFIVPRADAARCYWQTADGKVCGWTSSGFSSSADARCSQRLAAATPLPSPLARRLRRV
jgi:hypothetical protein